MISKRIGICGAPRVGKTTILKGLKKLTNSRGRSIMDSGHDCLTQLDVASGEFELEFNSTLGSVIYQERVFTNLLSKSDEVIYVLSADPMKQYQNDFFKDYTAIAKRLGRHWSDIPWIFVLNQMDLGVSHPILEEIPIELKNSVVHTVAIQGRGIGLLWERILTACLPSGMHWSVPSADQITQFERQITDEFEREFEEMQRRPIQARSRKWWQIFAKR